MTKELQHWYRHFRAHQRKLMAEDQGTLTTFPGGRTERTFSACYGEHALSAFASARNHIRFRRDLAKTVAGSRKRSKAAKRGWETRKAKGAAE